MITISLLVVLFAGLYAYAQTVHITPFPVKAIFQKGTFTISKNTVLSLPKETVLREAKPGYWWTRYK